MVIKAKVKRKLKNEEETGDSSEAKITKLEEPEIEIAVTPSTPKVKKAKQKSDFDVKHFRKELNSKKAQSVSLNQFLHVCTKGDNTVDYIALYLENGGNLSEILNQIDEANKKNTLLANSVFSLLRLILVKIQSSSPQLLQSAEETCRYFLNSYVSTIDVMMNDKSNTKQQKNTLKLLEAIVNFNVEMGFTVLNQLTLQPKSLSHLVKYQNTKETDSVRSCFIAFILAFLKEGSTPLIKTMLDKQGLMAVIFPELFKDKAETILNILQMLKSSITNNIEISKTIKIRTFNQHVLGSIFKLYNWKGYNVEKSIATVQKIEIETSVTDLLLILCTSHKFGIYFTDKTLGTGDTPTSQSLWKTIESLEAPWNNESAGKLIIKMVSNCPDLFRPVKNLVEQSFEPRISEQWCKTVTFLKDLLKALPAENIIKNMGSLSPVQFTNFVRNVYLPIPILKMSTGALSKAHNSIRNELILLLNVMLSSVKSYLTLISKSESQYSTFKPVLKSRLENFIPKHFPTTDTLITVLHSVLDNTVSESESENTDSFKMSSPLKSKFLINILDLLLLYNDILPNSFDPLSTMLDSKRLFDKMETIDENDKGELKLKITKFLLSADKYAFSPEKPLFKEILLSMFDVYISEDITVSDEAKCVLHNILETTGIFDKNKSEIDLILHTIYMIGYKCDSKITSTMVEIVENTYLSCSKYEALLAKHTMARKEENINIDINFDILFDNIENNTYQDKLNLYEEKPCFTYFLLGLLEYKMKNADHDLNRFTNNFVINLFHYQETVPSILEALTNYELDSDVQKYVSSWTKNPMQLPNKIIKKHDVFHKLSYLLLAEEELNLIQVFNLKEVTEKEEHGNYINLDNTYEILDNFNVIESTCWFHMILFYTTQQSSLGLLTEIKKSNAAKAFYCVLEIVNNINHSTDEVLPLVKLFLSNEFILNNFTPYGKKLTTSQMLLTELTLDILKFCFARNINEMSLHHSLSPYRHKTYMSLMNQIRKSKKCKKGVTFDNLHNVLSLINLNSVDASAILSDILNLNVSCMVSDENEASSWIFVICYVINQSIRSSNRLSVEIVMKIANLYSKIIVDLDIVINVTDLEESIYNYLICFPEFINIIPHSVFKASFSVKHVSKFTSKLSALLLRVNPSLLTKFNEYIVKEEVLGKRELVLPLTLAAFQHLKMNSFENIINAIYNHYKSNIQKLIEKPHKATQIYKDNYKVVVQLIHRCMETTECENYMKKVHKFDSMEEFHIEILEALFLKTTLKQENVDDSLYAENYLLNILQLANILLKRDSPQLEKLEKIYLALENFLDWSLHNSKPANADKENFSKVRNSPVWQSFFKSALKLHLKTTSSDRSESDSDVLKKYSLLDLSAHLINLIYPEKDSDIENLFEMTTSHSEFLNIMLSTRYTDIKTPLVKLLFVMVSNNKNVMKSAHIPVYLSSYHASRSISDQTILCLLRYYESNGQSMLEYQPYLWGDMAANHYAVRSKRKKSSLWSNPTVNHLLNLLDKDIIELTVKKFPIHAKMNTEECILQTQSVIDAKNLTEQTIDHIIGNRYANNAGKNNDDLLSVFNRKMATNRYKKCLKVMTNVQFANDSHSMFESAEVYDPVFLLPLLNFILSPGSAVSCHRIIRCGVLAIPLVALSSDCPLMRAAAFNVLHRFYSHLEAEMYYKNDKLIWTQFIDTIKNSMESAISPSDESLKTLDTARPRLPSIGSLFIARAAFIMTRPLDPMFKPINSFVISKQYINFSVVPDLLDLFHNTDVQYLERRTWIIEVLRDGIKNFSDIKVLLKSVAYKIILDFYSSNLSDIPTKLLLLEVINSSICIPKAAKILTEGYGLFPWLSNTFRNINIDNKNILSMAITIISNLWLSLLCESIPKVLSSDNKTDDDKIDLIINKCFKISDTLHSEILCLLLDILRNLRVVTLAELIVYLNVFRKISRSSLKHVSQLQILSLIKECDVLTKCKQLKIFTEAVENKKVNNIVTSLTVLKLNCKNTEVDIISRYLHEILINWLS